MGSEFRLEGPVLGPEGGWRGGGRGSFYTGFFTRPPTSVSPSRPLPVPDLGWVPLGPFSPGERRDLAL